MFERFKNHKQLLISTILLLGVSFIDVSNIDNIVYRNFCSIISKLALPTHCARYYDVSIWELLVAIGTISAAYFAYQAVKDSNRRLEIEQSPYLVFNERIITNAHNQLHVIMIKNVGRGSAIRVTATSDPEGKISIIDGSNPHSIDLLQGEPHNNWAINENRVVEGLKEQGILVESTVMEDLPDENTLEIEQREKSDFNLYLWYEDQLEHEYVTVGKFRHSGPFLKLMRNKVERIK
jgi:hypothetical protein